MKDEITTISYTENDWPKLMAEKLTIDAVNREIIINNKDERMIRKCTEADWQKIEHLISKCNFMQWKENYFEPVLDGTTWDIEIVIAPQRNQLKLACILHRFFLEKSFDMFRTFLNASHMRLGIVF